MQLSEHFTRAEFERSSTALRLAIDNRIPDAYLPNAITLAAMLERIRQTLWRIRGHECAIRLESGFRCQALNTAVGGAVNSDHTVAAAADWEAPAFGTPFQICQALESRVDELGIGQLINELPPNGWVHTSILRPPRPVNRVITRLAGVEGFLAGVLPGVA